jgi:hypothetical protein
MRETLSGWFVAGATRRNSSKKLKMKTTLSSRGVAVSTTGAIANR